MADDMHRSPPHAGVTRIAGARAPLNHSACAGCARGGACLCPTRSHYLDAIERIGSGKWRFFVSRNGPPVDVVVATNGDGAQYIK
jgi:hypothetical protein